MPSRARRAHRATVGLAALVLSAACGRVNYARRPDAAAPTDDAASDAFDALDTVDALDDVAPADAIDTPPAADAPDARDAPAAADADVPDAGPPPSTADDVTVGADHTCALRRGALSCWGANTRGALGLGDTTARRVPTAVATTATWRAVVAGEGASCALDAAGVAWCWGANAAGQLGVGDTSDRLFVVRSGTVGGSRTGWRAIALGYRHTCAIAADQTLWCWGANALGQLGQGDPAPGADAPAALQVGTANDWVAVSTGRGHTCGIRAPGALYCWGDNAHGQLGLGAGAPTQARVPTRVGAADDWTQLSAGADSTCAVEAPGALYCWGSNRDAQLGLGFGAATQLAAPTRVGAESSWRAVRVATTHTCGLRGTALYCWGTNRDGQLGAGDTMDRAEPTRVGASQEWAGFAVGVYHSCAQTTAGQVFCTGANGDFQLGLNDALPRNVFTPVTLPGM